ncbi:hypothetical protein [Enterobacter bugandensis]|uniref:hypothetical protein n=1 Tax=Enterobacter bugandensis TaxID=881260 RepID=UPI002003F1BE|nr:hypothetical protein [Enterobacter bugandensis]MCK6894950.1 hypothetical protein [Enterobacter bugandensis]
MLVRRAVKTVYFIALFLPVGRALGPADEWFSYVWANRIGEMLHGPDEIGQDSLYEIYTYIGMMTILLITTVIYLLTVTLLNEIRK